MRTIASMGKRGSRVQSEANKRDRKVGLEAEHEFCSLVSSLGLSFQMHQAGRNEAAVYWDGKYKKKRPGPDVSVFGRGHHQHHEIKHKTRRPESSPFAGCYGLEEYRLTALRRYEEITGQPAFYTVHDYALSGGKGVFLNDMGSWLSAPLSFLAGKERWGSASSYIRDKKRQRVDMVYWDAQLWVPLGEILP